MDAPAESKGYSHKQKAPLYDLMHRRLLQSFAIHADDTPVVLLRPRRTAFAWVYLGDVANPYTLFDLTPGRSQTYPQAFLSGYTGFVHADAYDGYNAVHGNLRHLGCWMHARRYFVEAEPTDPRAVEGLAFIRTLYAVERDLKDERGRLGEHFSGTHVDELISQPRELRLPLSSQRWRLSALPQRWLPVEFMQVYR
jgi:hypothetical protein